MNGLRANVLAALAIFGPATDADLVARLRRVAERRGRTVSVASVLAARQGLSRQGLIEPGPLGRATTRNRGTKRWQVSRRWSDG